MRRGIIAAIVLALASAPGSGWAQGSDREPMLRYRVRLDERNAQIVGVDMTIGGITGPWQDLALPVWRPGRYVVLDMAGTVLGAEARDAAGNPLAINKTDKTTWRIATGGASTITVSYRIYANSLGDRTRHVDDTHAFLDGSAVFFYAPGRLDEPVQVRIDAPEGWDVATGLDADPDDPLLFSAPDYHVLVDSPFEIGLHDRLAFDVDGVPHEIVIWGRSNHGQRDLTGDFARIVSQERDVFGDMPYQRYVYIIHCAPGARGGTEHLNSTVMQTSPSVFDTTKSYNGFLGLVAHEMFHTWNVKQLRPAGLVPYDYAKENYTRLLWVAEGTTSYYTGVVLTRAGLLKADKYLDRLAGSITAFRRRPGRHVQSLEQSSFDAWIKFNKPDPNSRNSTVSFYSKGSLVSLLLDMEIRAQTGNAASLDDVMRELYQRFPRSGPGFTPQDLIDAVQDVAGADLAPFFDRYVRGTDPLDLEAALATAGLALEREKKKQKDDAEDDANDDPKTRPDLGLSLRDRDGRIAVRSVDADGPAWRAGVLVGDEVVAVDGVRVAGASLDPYVRFIEPGQAVRLTIFRYDQLRTVEIIAGEPIGPDWTITRVSEPTDLQRAAYESWLGQPWPTKGDTNESDEQPKDGEPNGVK